MTSERPFSKSTSTQDASTRLHFVLGFCSIDIFAQGVPDITNGFIIPAMEGRKGRQTQTRTRDGMSFSQQKNKVQQGKYMPLDPLKYWPLLKIRFRSIFSSNKKVKKPLSQKECKSLPLSDEVSRFFSTHKGHGSRGGPNSYELAYEVVFN